ncbi:MAG TPA: Crp/Fnr family transcriptional regulator [Hyphomonadaceae bacterium]|nr:Crp/Fnr family transcriptional regulator [Hyphomonadaceae bacterium]
MPSRDLLAKLQGYFPVTHELRTDLNELAKERVTLDAGETLVRTGEKFKTLFLVEDGWLLRARYLPGGGRQIVNVGLPGDFMCFNALMFEKSEFDIVAKTPASLWKLETQSFRTMMKRHPGLAEALVWSNAHEEALLAERVVSLGRRDATQRLAHVLCEIVVRLQLIDRHKGEILQLPLIQEDFGDILGISVIHVLRVFKRLEAAGIVDYRSRRITILDPEKLRRIAGFEGDYLYFSQRKDVLPQGMPK